MSPRLSHDEVMCAVCEQLVVQKQHNVAQLSFIYENNNQYFDAGTAPAIPGEQG